MFGTKRLLGLLAMPALAASVAMAPAASAQSPSPQVECSLVTAEEVAGVFAVTDVYVESWSDPFDCSFGGGAELTASIVARTDLVSTKTEYPSGVDLTVAGLPAWFSMSDSSLWVDAGGQLLYLSAYSSTAEAMTGDAFQAAMVTLAERALPRLPAGPSEEDIARMEAIIPDTFLDEAVTVQITPFEQLMGDLDTADPDVKAFLDALAAQGKSTADILVAVGMIESDSDTGTIVAQIKGADASRLLLPFINAGFSGASSAAVTTSEIGGKQVKVIATEPIWNAYATGDLAIYAIGPDEFLQEYFASLP
jgi:hypothetical protein